MNMAKCLRLIEPLDNQPPKSTPLAPLHPTPPRQVCHAGNLACTEDFTGVTGQPLVADELMSLVFFLFVLTLAHGEGPA